MILCIHIQTEKKQSHPFPHWDEVQELLLELQAIISITTKVFQVFSHSPVRMKYLTLNTQIFDKENGD